MKNGDIVSLRRRRQASPDHLARKRKQIEARYSRHLLPQGNKYRLAAVGCLATAHGYLKLYRAEKAHFERMRAEGIRPHDFAIMCRARRHGGEADYLRDILSMARGYLRSAYTFGKQAYGILP